MTDGYRINVSLNGKHFFATALHSAQTERKARELYKSFKEKFPESDGYKITISYWESVGKPIIF